MPRRSTRTFHPAPRWLRVAAGLVPLLAAACEAPSPVSSPPADPVATERPRLVLLGLDAGTWDLLGPWMDEGKLPNLARIRDQGVHGPLRSTEPSSSPVIWTSIATGKVPEKTGIDWFVRFPNGPGKPVPVDRRQRRTDAMWNILSRARIDVAVLGWYVTWPAESVHGRLLSDVAHFGRSSADRFPDGFLWDLPVVPPADAVAAMPRFMDFEYDASRATRPAPDPDGKPAPPTLDYLVYDRFLRAWTRDRFYVDAASATLADGPLPEALMLYLRGTDDVQHGFWKFMDPEPFASAPGGPVPAGQVEALGKVIERYWQWTDEEVGRLLARYGDSQPLVVVCSDHGAGPAVGDHGVGVPEYLHLSGSHRIDGVLLMSGPGIRQGGRVDGATIYDVLPTILHALDLPVGRDMDGRVLEDAFAGPAAERPVRYVETHDRGRDDADAGPDLPADVDRQVLEHLRSLGYIGE